MTREELLKFCHNDEEPGRNELRTPWTDRGFTYATNGHILVRVPAVEGVEVVKSPVNAEKVLKDFDPNSPKKLSLTGLSAPVPQWMERLCECGGEGVCQECDDVGEVGYAGKAGDYWITCPCCLGRGGGECEDCDENGNVRELEFIFVRALNQVFNAHYIQLILSLPNPVLYAGKYELSTAFFTFDGGIGCLSPMYISKNQRQVWHLAEGKYVTEGV